MCEKNHINGLKILIEKDINSEIFNDIFNSMCKYGFLEIFKNMLKDDRIVTNNNYNNYTDIIDIFIHHHDVLKSGYYTSGVRECIKIIYNNNIFDRPITNKILRYIMNIHNEDTEIIIL